MEQKEKLYGIWYATENGTLLKYVLAKTPYEAQVEFRRIMQNKILDCIHYGKKNNSCKVYEELN